MIRFLIGGSCMSMLLDWVRWHFTKPDRLAEEILWCDEPSSHENYWHTVSCFILLFLSSCLICLLVYCLSLFPNTIHSCVHILYLIALS